jgi:SNF2 family DNA or RNA helicase
LAIWDSVKSKTKKWALEFEEKFNNDRLTFFINIEAFQGKNELLLSLISRIKDPFIILDESSLIKCDKAVRTKSIIKIFKKSPHKLILTGTEIGTSLTDIYSQIEFLNYGFWKSKGIQSAYHFSMCFEIKKKIYLAGGVTREAIKKRQEMSELEKGIYDSNLKKVYDLIEPFSFRVKREDCQSLPEKVEEDIVFSLNPVEKTAYESMKNELILEIENAPDVVALNAAVLFSRLRILTGGWGSTEHKIMGSGSKLNALLSHIELHDEPCIIACAFSHEVIEVSQALSKIAGVSIFHGKNVNDRDDHLELFRSGVNRFFVCNMTAAAKSLNLQFCSMTYRYSRVLSPTDNLQFEARTDRQGQVNSPRFYDLMAKDTVDYRVRENIKNGVNLLERFQNIGRKELIGLLSS